MKREHIINNLINIIDQNKNVETAADRIYAYLNATGLLKTDLIKEDMVACEHEMEDNIYTSLPPKYRCKKCLKFFPAL